MCAVLKVFRVLVVTLSLVSCSVSPRKRNTKYRFLSFWIFVVHFCTCSQTVFCDCQFFSVANYCTLLHRENESFEVLSLQHARCKVMYRCACARHCAVETDTQQGYQRAENRQTNLGSYSIPTELMSPSHDSSHAITPYLGNKVICG